MKNVYVCNYCGEFIIAEGTKESPTEHIKCKTCGCSNATFFVPEHAFHPPYSDKIINLRFWNLVPQWEEHKRQGITPTSGETPMPKCPTCGSENIRRISQNERASNALMFGLYGNKRKYQFECLNPNCKYKW